MSSSVGQARAALGARLRELRRDARLSGKELAAACGWHPAKVSRLEHGHQQPSEDDLLAWCRATDAMMVYDDLIANLRNLRSMYLEWRRIIAGGRAHRQRQSLDIEHRARSIRWFETWVIPGLLQTPDYAAAVFTACRGVIPGGRDDVDEAVAIRMTRQKILRTQRRFVFIIAEAALHQRIGGPALMREQLYALLDHATNPRIELAILPLAANSLVASHGFIMFDRDSVMVETVSAELTVTRPSEIAIYDDVFVLLQDLALHGAAATALISEIAAATHDDS
ncbi:helix-turn-helix domain-containing protein [Nocardia asiatica]|uniref:helix-turn-helix domain-containing protein n=1 Tax=Nocardia asiatica TaxID=209252 RepID=UPI0002D67091|nr:helix-turn-helix transcriptional regulator [Nocardia asiatica]